MNGNTLRKLERLNGEVLDTLERHRTELTRLSHRGHLTQSEADRFRKMLDLTFKFRFQLAHEREAKERNQ